MDNNDGALSFDADINEAEFERKLKKLENEIKGFGSTVNVEGAKMNNVFASIATGAVAAFSFDQALQFRSKLIAVTGEFQKYQAVLANSLGNEKDAAESMKMLADTASNTPFQLDKLTESYVKLVNQGFKPSREEIIKLGDLASSTGKGFDQLSEAVLDAQTGEFERLKEFGIKASASGDQISFAFKGVTTTVENSSEAIRNYILGLGDMKGVKGSMEAISKTLVGQVSNLEDSITAMFNKIGQSSEGFLSDSISATKFLVDNYEAIGVALGSLLATYGAYKTAVIAVTAFEKARNTFMIYDIATKSTVITVDGLMTVATNKLAAAQARLNATMLLNPYVLLATAAVGLVALMWSLSDSTSAAEQAQSEYNNRKNEAAAYEDKHREAIGKLIDAATNEYAATLERVSALDELKATYPQLFSQYDIETLKLADILSLKKQIAEVESKKKVLGNQVDAILETRERDRLQAILDKTNKEQNPLVYAKLKKDLDKQNALLDKYNEQVQTDRINNWTATIQNQTETALNAEIKARKAAIAKLESLPKGTKATISGGAAAGNFSKEELEAQTITIERELAKRNELTYNYSQLQKKYSDEITKLEKERIAILGQKLTENELTKQIAAIDAKISAVEKKKKALEGKSGSAKPKAEDIVLFDYTDTLAKSFKEGTDIIENETDKWNKIISEATQTELEEMVKVAEAESGVAQKKAEIQADALAQSRTLSEKLSKIKTEYAAKEAALIASNAEFMPAKLAELEKLKKAEIASVVEGATQILSMGKLKLKDFLANTAAKIEAMKAEGKSVEALQAIYDSASTALEKMPSEDPFVNLSKSLTDYGDAADDVSKKEQLAAIFSAAAIAARELQGEISGVVDILFDLGAINADQADSINNTAGQVAGLVQGAATLATGIMNLDPAAIIKGGIEIVGNAIKLLDVKSKNIAKSQKSITDEIKNMDAAYKKLDRSINSAVGTDVYKLQLEKYKLNAQEMLKYDELIALERSKKKKKQNQDDIDAWNEAKESLKFDNEDIVASINLRLTNTTAETITDSIVQGFANGESSVADFADNFEELMKNALLQALKVQALEGPIKQWYETFAGYLSDGILSPEENKKAKAAWDAIISNADKTWDAMAQGTGMDFSANGQLAKANNLTGEIKGVTEETASVLAGQITSIKLGQIETIDFLRQQLFHLANIDANTYNLIGMKKTLETIEGKLSGGVNASSL